MKKSLSKMFSVITILALMLMALPVQSVEAISPDIVISQVYGGGGNSGATYTHDFIELFNRGTTSVNLNGWSVQYASATGTGNFGANTTQLTELPNVSLAPGQYLLIQEASQAAVGSPLPTPDVTDASPIAMAAGAGKVAVVNSAASLGCNGGSNPCSPAQLAMIVDLIGYGNANFFEGAAAPTLGNSTSASRASNGCVDTDNNSSDFSAGAPNPRNTASPLNPCSTAAEPKINEFSASTTGNDVEFVEIFGTPNTDYSAYTILEIEGEGAGIGVVDEVISVGSTDANGFWLQNLANGALENGTLSLLLVKNFTGALNNDLDTNNDGAFDVTPWDAVTDAVSVNDGTVGDITFGVTSLGPNYDGLGSFAPGGASRIPDGSDTDSAADWARNDFDLVGIPGFDGTPVIGEAYNTPGASNELITIVIPPFGVCGGPATLIHDVQGNGLASPLAGTVVVIEGVVVSNFQGTNQIGGYHVQEEDAQADADPLTSEGIYIFDNTNTPGVGDVVRVEGIVTEFSGLTEIGGIVDFANCSTGSPLPATTALSLPVTSVNYFEAYEGMLVTFPQALVISEYFNFDRFGEIVLTSERHLTPTAEFDPASPQATQAAADFLLDKITLDDGRGNQNPDPAIHPDGADFDLTNLFRGGDTVANVTGVMDYAFGLYRIQPTQGADYTSVNPRTLEPDDVGGSLKVASFNVLNYFTTIDTGAFICGPAGNQECRGADDANELDRQRAKIIAAMSAIDADIFGLIEIENHPADVPTADLVSGLNDVFGPGTYDYIATGAIGTDAIRLAFIYKPAAVTPVGQTAVLDTVAFVNGGDSGPRSRPSLAQAFQQNSTGATFVVDLNHLKSKGSACDDDPVPTPVPAPLQGNCNQVRVNAATELMSWLATDPTGTGDPDVLLIGDLNSYDKEDPIDVIVANGYTDMVFQFQGEEAYSYVFDGQTGYLDHALANASLVSQITGVTDWHINSDEADLIDYDTTFKEPNQDAINAPDAYRSSDHDPVIIGLDLDFTATCNGLPATIVGTTGDDVINGTNGVDVIAGLGGNDTIYGGNGNDVICGDFGNDTLNGGNGNDTLLGSFGNDDLDGGNGNDSLSGGDGNDALDGGNGNDTLSGGDGTDILLGQNGNDVLDGGSGNDILTGHNGDDVLTGADGNDTLTGGNGNDSLDGGAHDDSLVGNNGSDTLTGGTGADSFSGGLGGDTNTDFNAGEGDTSDGT
jgi:predicted extracellular nuclease